MDSGYELTVGKMEDGRTLAIISTGGHLQHPGSGEMLVLTVEVVDGWGRRKLNDWFQRQIETRPWETRQ